MVNSFSFAPTGTLMTSDTRATPSFSGFPPGDQREWRILFAESFRQGLPQAKGSQKGLGVLLNQRTSS